MIFSVVIFSVLALASASKRYGYEYSFLGFWIFGFERLHIFIINQLYNAMVVQI